MTDEQTCCDNVCAMVGCLCLTGKIARFCEVIFFADEDCWTAVPNTHSLGSQRYPAANLTACQEACWNNNSCDGVDWNPGLPTGQQCWLIGPWTTTRQAPFPDITQYVLNRTDCGKLEYHIMRYENMFDVQLVMSCMRVCSENRLCLG